MEEEVTSQINSFKTFLENINHSHSFENADEDFLQGTTLVAEEDFEAEVLDWALQYLLGLKCPSALAAALARNVLLEVKTVNLKEICHTNTGVSDSLGYQPIDLWRIVVSKVHDICQQWQDAPEDDLRALASHKEMVSLCAIKNTRRTMEDRHVVIQDLNILFGLQGHPKTSFFAVFDGHAGTGAACYSAVHLHYNIIHHPSYPHDIKTAMKEGFTKTDANFISKSNREGLKSGSTALCCLLRDKEMYLAWLGDSQAILVRDGAAIEMMTPHKPDREDERERIEKLGGCVVHFGTWRVNGTLAVSRAIGDAEYKPYVSSDPDVDVTHLDGMEDFIILACDGLWDVLQPNDVVKQVYSYLAQTNGDADGVAAKLVQVAKQKGSGDNITVLAVFLRDVSELINELVIPESPKNDISFSTPVLTKPLNGNPFGDSFPLETGKTISFETFGSEFVKVESNSTCLTSTIQTVDDGTFPVTNPTFAQEFLPEWGAANFTQQIEGDGMGGFVEDLPSNRKNFPPFENPFGQYEQPEIGFERPDQLGLENQFYAATNTANFFAYQAKTEEDNLVEFENNVADWPDNASGVQHETNSFGLSNQYNDSELHKGLFDTAKPFQSNLSPDAEPFVMGSRIHAGDEFSQSASHVPSQPLEAFIDAKPYTPYSRVEAEVMQNEEPFASAAPDLLASGNAFVPVHDQIEPSTEIPTAPPAESGLFDEFCTTNDMSPAERLELESVSEKTYVEEEFVHGSRQDTLLEELQQHMPSEEVVESEGLPSQSQCEGILESASPGDQQRQSFGEFVLQDDIAGQASLQSPESVNIAVEHDVLEISPSGDNLKSSAEDFAFGDIDQFTSIEAQPLQSAEQENIDFEHNVCQSGTFENLQSPFVEDFTTRVDPIDVVARSPLELENFEATADNLQNLPSEFCDRFAEETKEQELEFTMSHSLEDQDRRVVEASSPVVEELVSVPESQPDSIYAELDHVEFEVGQENVALQQDVIVEQTLPQDLTVEQTLQHEIEDVKIGLEDRQVLSPTAEVLTNVETIVSEVKFDYLESSTGASSEALVSDVDLQSDFKLDSTQLTLDAKEAEAPSAEPVVDAIPDTVPIADDVEDDESEDGEEWKFYRSGGAEHKPAENAEMPPVELPSFNGHADAEILTSDLNVGDVSATVIDLNNSAEEEAEVNSSFEELNVKSTIITHDVSEVTTEAEVLPLAEPLELEQVKTVPIEEPPKPAEAPKEPTKPKAPTTKTAAKPTTKTIGNKVSSTAASQKLASTGKVGASKPSEVQKRPASKTAAPKTSTVAAPKPLAATLKASTTAPKPSKPAVKAAIAPSKKPAPVTDATKKAPAARPKPLPPTSKVEATARVAPIRPPSDATIKKTSSSTSSGVKVSKEQSNVRSKAPAAANGVAKDTTLVAKKLQSTASSVTSRLTTKPSSAPVKEAIKKDVTKTSTISRTASARVDVKQTKDTVNKQISVVSKRVSTTTTATKTSSVKLDANGTKGPVATSSPKTSASAASSNKEAAEKKPTSGVKATPKPRTPIARSLINSSPNNASTTRSPALSKTPSKTPVAAVRERGTMPKSPLKSSTPGKPIRKSPAATVGTITGKSPSKGKVEEATNEKGILDATSKENGTTENGVQNGVNHTLENGNGHGVEGEEHSEQQQGDADLVLV